ncbi:MAG: thioredoxin family protein [Paracoccaceae bacterium]
MLPRRRFIMSSAAMCLIPSMGQAYSAQMFSPNLWSEMRESSDVVIMNYRASWSLTCQIKADILAELIATHPQYKRLTFVEVDWDTFGPSVLTQRLGVKRRSTLLVMKQGKEVARVVNEPFVPPIQALLDRALTA